MTDLLPIRESLPDSRDRLASTIAGAIPDQVELDVYEVENQQQFNSCVANAMCSALEIFYKRLGQPRDLSRMYHYWWTRALSKLQGQDIGSDPRSMCKAVARFGICDEATYPYDSANLFRVPTEAAIIEALPHDGWLYERIPTPTGHDGVPEYTACNTAIKEQLAAGIPVLMSIEVDEYFTTACTGPWRAQEWRKYVAGTRKYLHQVLVVGYDDRPEAKRFKVLNSWGTAWGDGGYFGLLYQPLKGQVWQLGTVKELWIIKPK